MRSHLVVIVLPGLQHGTERRFISVGSVCERRAISTAAQPVSSIAAR
jgi:hypothetical protein